MQKAFIADQPILQDTWNDIDGAGLCNFSRRDPWDSNLVDSFDPRVLSAKASKYNEDNPTWEMAMNGPFSAEYWKACETELKTLEDEMNVWTLVERTPDMNVLPSTWAFKLKRFPDLLPKKFKARFCVRGDRQIHGVDYFETWAPVVHWSTIRTVMILAAKER